MKTSLYVILLTAASVLIQGFDPIYTVLISSIFLSVAFRLKSGIAFAASFAAVYMGWLSYCIFLDRGMSSQYSSMIGNIFQGISGFNLKIITAFVGGITAGLGAWFGASVRQMILGRLLLIGLLILTNSHVFSQSNYAPNRAIQLYRKAHGDARVFVNYFDQLLALDGGNRETIYSTALPEIFVGITHKLTLGLRLKFRSMASGSAVELNDLFCSADAPLDSKKRSGFTSVSVLLRHGIGTSTWVGQHSVSFPLARDLEDNTKGWLDWNHFSLQSQFFHNYQQGRFYLFFEGSAMAENLSSNIFRQHKDYYWQGSLPCTFIPGYRLLSSFYMYSLFQISQLWQFEKSGENRASLDFNPYTQLGLGAKYFIGTQLEVEAITSIFKNLKDSRQLAYVLNGGLRYYF